MGVDDAAFLKELNGAVAELSVGRVVRDSDAILFGVAKASDLQRLPTLKTMMKPDGALWVIRPKGRPEISETAVMAAGAPRASSTSKSSASRPRTRQRNS